MADEPTATRYRLLGRSGLRVSQVFLGTMTFGSGPGCTPAPEAHRILDAYAEAGGNVLDTANVYPGDGSSERILGDWLGPERDRFVVATKYTLSTDPRDPNASGNHRKSLVRSLERSLTSLQTDYIDLLWVHIWDPNTPLEETMRALDDQVRAGKVLYVGISDAPGWVVSRANTLAELRGWTPFVGLQVPYSLVRRDIERDLLPMADALGLSTAVWAPLARGLLSGALTRATSSRAHRTDRDSVPAHHLEIAREVDAVADQAAASSAQVALAWLMSRSAGLHPIVGASRVEQLTDNLAAAGLVLPDEALARLNQASAIDLGFPLDFITGAFPPP